MSSLIGAIDQGTSSTRVTIYDSAGNIIAFHQVSVSRSTPHPGWIEQNPLEIENSVRICLNAVASKLEKAGKAPKDVIAFGITNQRETLVVWEKHTGRPLYNAIVWCDNRNADLVDSLIQRYGGSDAFIDKTGLPLSPYFTATKLMWLRQNEPTIQQALDDGRCLVGTIDTWLTYCLTGGNTFVTDVTNASRTMLMDIRKLEWDDDMLEIFGVPRGCLPKIQSSAELYGCLTDRYGDFQGCVISGIIGDQQASLVGNDCVSKGMAKITYGTGCFLLYNTGDTPTFSKSGLITTVAYKMGKKSPVCYALEGSVATCGFAVQWLTDILGRNENIVELAATVPDSGGVYFVPAFSGLLCPYWRADARGCFHGLTGYSTRAHMARAVIEGIAFQAMDVLDVIKAPLNGIKVDGGLARSDLLLQFQADILNIEVRRAANVEATSKGAAIAAAHGFSMANFGITLGDNGGAIFSPQMDRATRAHKKRMWEKAVSRSMDWVESESKEDENEKEAEE